MQAAAGFGRHDATRAAVHEALARTLFQSPNDVTYGRCRAKTVRRRPESTGFKHGCEQLHVVKVLQCQCGPFVASSSDVNLAPIVLATRLLFNPESELLE